MERQVLERRLAVVRRERVPNPTISAFLERGEIERSHLGVGLSLPLPLPSPVGRTRAGGDRRDAGADPRRGELGGAGAAPRAPRGGAGAAAFRRGPPRGKLFPADFLARARAGPCRRCARRSRAPAHPARRTSVAAKPDRSAAGRHRGPARRALAWVDLRRVVGLPLALRREVADEAVRGRGRRYRRRLAASGCPRRQPRRSERPAPAAARGRATGLPPRPDRRPTRTRPSSTSSFQPRCSCVPRSCSRRASRPRPAVSDSLPATVDLTGEIAADPDRSARLAARVSGRIVEVKAKEGDRVKAGQTIAVLESPELARARATLASSSARAKVARLNADRLSNLESKNLASGQEVAAAAGEASALDAEAGGGQANALGVRAGRGRSAGRQRARHDPHPARRIRSQSGRRSRPDRDGRARHRGRRRSRPRALPRPSVREGPRARQGRARARRCGSTPIRPRSSTGKIETIGRQLDPAARTVTARILVDEPRRSGARSACSAPPASSSVPRSAGGPARGRSADARSPKVAQRDVVFVRQPDGDFELHPVTVGRSAGGPRRDPRRPARRRAGRRRGRLHAQERDPQEHVRRGGVTCGLLSADRRAGRCGNRAVVLLGDRCCCVVRRASAPRSSLPIDAVPDITNVQVQVITAAPALSPVEVEQYVTVPVERAMAGIPAVDGGPLDLEVRHLGGHRRVRGRHRHLLRAAAGASSACARRRTRSRRQYGRPEMGPISTGLGEIYQFVVRGTGHSLMELEETLDWYIGPQLRTVPGHRRGEQLRRRGQAVPGRASTRSACRPPACRSARWSRALERINANAGRRLHRAQPRALRDRHRRPGDEPRRSRARRRRRDAAGRPDHGRQRRRRALRAAPAPRRRAHGRQGRGRGRRGPDADGRELAHRDRGGEGASSRSCSPTLPAGIEIEPFYDRSAAGRTARSRRSATNLLEGAAARHRWCCSFCSGDLRAGLVVAATIPLSHAVRGHRDASDRRCPGT